MAVAAGGPLSAAGRHPGFGGCEAGSSYGAGLTPYGAGGAGGYGGFGGTYPFGGSSYDAALQGLPSSLGAGGAGATYGGGRPYGETPPLSGYAGVGAPYDGGHSADEAYPVNGLPGGGVATYGATPGAEGVLGADAAALHKDPQLEGSSYPGGAMPEVIKGSSMPTVTRPLEGYESSASARARAYSRPREEYREYPPRDYLRGRDYGTEQRTPAMGEYIRGTPVVRGYRELPGPPYREPPEYGEVSEAPREGAYSFPRDGSFVAEPYRDGAATYGASQRSYPSAPPQPSAYHGERPYRDRSYSPLPSRPVSPMYGAGGYSNSYGGAHIEGLYPRDPRGYGYDGGAAGSYNAYDAYASSYGRGGHMSYGPSPSPMPPSWGGAGAYPGQSGARGADGYGGARGAEGYWGGSGLPTNGNVPYGLPTTGSFVAEPFNANAPSLSGMPRNNYYASSSTGYGGCGDMLGGYGGLSPQYSGAGNCSSVPSFVHGASFGGPSGLLGPSSFTAATLGLGGGGCGPSPLDAGSSGGAAPPKAKPPLDAAGEGAGAASAAGSAALGAAGAGKPTQKPTKTPTFVKPPAVRTKKKASRFGCC